MKPIRYMKLLLAVIYIYIGLFGAAVFVANVAGVQIQDSLIAGICVAIGAESLISGLIKAMEIRAEQKARREEREAEQNKNAGDTGRKVDHI